MTTNDSIRAALEHVPAHDRDTWLRMGMAVKSELGDGGFDLWNEWSQQDASYREADARAVWDSIKYSGKVTVGTLYHEAQRHGFKVNDHARPAPPTAEEAERRAQAAAQCEAEEAAKHEAAATRATRVFKAALPARSDHPYLERKRVAPVVTLRELPADEITRHVGYVVKSKGEPLAGRLLIAPVRSGDAISTLEFIDEAGRKAALAGGAKAGGYWSAQRMPEGDGDGLTLYVAEGVATALSVAMGTGAPTFAALSCGNLPGAALALRARYPKAAIVVCGDVGNERDAHKAAAAVGGLVAVPDFGADRPDSDTDFNDLARHAGVEAVREAVARASAPAAPDQPRAGSAAVGDSGGSEWSEPQPLIADDETQPYPMDALPDGIGAAVAAVVDFVQCPPALAACSALSALSLVAQGLADVQRAEQLQGPTSLYLLTVAESGERKSACDKHFLGVVREWEREQVEQTRADVARSAARIEAWEAKRSGLRERIKEAKRKARDTADGEREFIALESERPERLRVPALILNDVTPEALAFTLASEWPAGGIMSSEAGIVFGGHAMQRDSVMRNLGLLNSLWDGAPHRVKRRTSEQFEVRGARLTMGLATQPETVRQFMDGTKGLVRGMGFAARFLLSVPVSTQGYRPFREASEWSRMGGYEDRLRALLALLPANVDRSGALVLPLLTMTPEARAVWIAFHDDVEAEQRPSGEMAETKDVASKAADNVARVAALFHLYAHGPSGQIGADAVRAAARIVAWHLYQARAFLGDVAAPPERANARRLDAWLLARCRSEGVPTVERRVIQQYGPGCVRGRPALEAALAELADAARVRMIEKGRLVQVNPALLEGHDGAS